MSNAYSLFKRNTVSTTARSGDLGIHEATFRVETNIKVALGVVSAAKASDAGDAVFAGFMYDSSGCYYRQGCLVLRFPAYGTGDRITVRLDLDASTVAFRKNGVDCERFGADVRSVQNITPGEAFQFAFDAIQNPSAVTIVEETE